MECGGQDWNLFVCFAKLNVICVLRGRALSGGINKLRGEIENIILC